MALGSLEAMAFVKLFSIHAISDLQVVKEVSLHQCTPENLALASVGLGHHLSEFATKLCIDDQEVTNASHNLHAEYSYLEFLSSRETSHRMNLGLMCSMLMATKTLACLLPLGGIQK